MRVRAARQVPQPLPGAWRAAGMASAAAAQCPVGAGALREVGSVRGVQEWRAESHSARANNRLQKMPEAPGCHRLPALSRQAFESAEWLVRRPVACSSPVARPCRVPNVDTRLSPATPKVGAQYGPPARLPFKHGGGNDVQLLWHRRAAED